MQLFVPCFLLNSEMHCLLIPAKSVLHVVSITPPGKIQIGIEIGIGIEIDPDTDLWLWQRDSGFIDLLSAG
ncbi:MAG: hypothetical protein ACQETG_03610 [Thermodesulfobacteriota bacterium]